MKFGLLVFYESENLGDDIQSYATEYFLPQVDYYIDREKMDSFSTESGEKVAVIMAGWYLENHLNWPPSPYINPLLISMHFDTYMRKFAGENIEKNHVLEGYGGNWLKRTAPVGCRDIYTKMILEKHNIPAYLSGCITLTINKLMGVEHHNKICLVDVPDQVHDYVETYYGDIIVMSHEMKKSDADWNNRKRNVEKTLQVYQGAKCVVTTRLHAALPCLAIGTPVLLLEDIKEYLRVGSWYEYVNHCSEKELIEGKYDEFLRSPSDNPQKYLQLRKIIIEKCKNYVDECRRLTFDCPADYVFQEQKDRVESIKELMKLRIDKYERLIGQ